MSSYVCLCSSLFFAVPPGDAQPASASGRTEGVRCWAQDSRKGAGCWNFATDRQRYVLTFSPKYRSNKCMWMPSCLLEALWNEYIRKSVFVSRCKGGHSSNQPLWLLGPTPNSNDLPRSEAQLFGWLLVSGDLHNGWLMGVGFSSTISHIFNTETGPRWYKANELTLKLTSRQDWTKQFVTISAQGTCCMMYKWTANDRKNGSPGSRFHQPSWSRRKRRPSSNHTGKDMSFQCCLGHWWYGRSSDRHLELYQGCILRHSACPSNGAWVSQRVCSSPICYFCYLGPQKGRGMCRCPSRCCRTCGINMLWHKFIAVLSYTFTYSCSLVLIMCVCAGSY